MSAGMTLDQFLDPYDIIKELGSGSYSTVYLAQEKKTGKQVAIKLFYNEFADNETIEKEFSIQKQFNCPYIIETYGLYKDADQWILLMEYASGGELFNEIVEHGFFSESDAALIVQQVLIGLKVLHESHIIHRDLKPENLLLSRDVNGEPVIKICDFGLSDVFGEKLMRDYCGTVGYAAPEIMMNVPYDETIDIWSLGVIVYVLMSGCTPFYGETDEILCDRVCKGKYSFPEARFGHISNEAKDFITKMLKVDPRERISIEEALNHPWIVGKAPKIDLAPTKEYLKQYQIEMKAKRVCALLKSRNRFSLLSQDKRAQ